MQYANDSDVVREREMEGGAKDRLLELLLLAEQRKKKAPVAIARRENPSTPAPLSFAQERLWFLEQTGLVGIAYNLPIAFTLHGNLDVDALHLSFVELTRRHESLRTRIEARDGVPYQIVDAAEAFRLHSVNIDGISDLELREWEVREWIKREQTTKFDVSIHWPIRVALARTNGIRHILVITMHHIASDGWSIGILVKEICALYAAYAAGRASPLPALPVQYADFAIWQRQWLRGEVMEEQLKYWKRKLDGAPPLLQLSTDRPRPPVESFKGAEHNFGIPSGVCSRLKELASCEEATLFMVILVAYQLLLSRWCGQTDISIGTPIAGRRHREIEGLIGFFANTLVLRADIESRMSFRELVKLARITTLEAYTHQDIPFEVVVKELSPERDLTRQPLFQVMLVLQNYPDRPGEQQKFGEVLWSRTEVECVSAHFDLTLYIREVSDGLAASFEYATDIFDGETVERMAGHFLMLLEEGARTPDCPTHQLSILGERERRQLVGACNATVASIPDEPVHHMFKEQAERTPDSIAIEFNGQNLLYKDLYRKADQLGAYLRTRGVGPEQLVGICVERCLDMVIAVIAVLKAGGAYLPLDPGYPKERLQYMLEDAKPRLVLTQAKFGPLLSSSLVDIETLETIENNIGNQATDTIQSRQRVTMDTLVYVMYTSGSTGRPKGTAMPHRSMANLIQWHRRCLGPGDGHRVLQFSALSFDVSFQEILSTLCTGGTLVLVDEWTRRDARELMKYASDHRIDRLFLPPLMLQTLAEYAEDVEALIPIHLQEVITAGEQLRITPEISRLFRKLKSCRLHNHYGPTEAHVVTTLTLDGDPENWVALPSIGRPISNCQIYILDRDLQLTPRGVRGEIYIGGISLARGYLNRAETTAGRFVPDSFGPTPGARLYRTGDLGRWKADGTVEYLGREDEQVKIRGYRIELGEIESHLLAAPNIKDAAVVVRRDASGERRLVAYVTPIDRRRVSVDHGRAYLKMVLPGYMMPNAFIELERLPLTPSGKLDRRALPEPESSDHLEERHDHPHDGTEEVLSRIWQELLGVNRIGRQSNFFELGGDSLYAVRLVAKINQRLHIRIPIVSVFKNPSIQSMAASIDALKHIGGDPIGADRIDFEEGAI